MVIIGRNGLLVTDIAQKFCVVTKIDIEVSESGKNGFCSDRTRPSGLSVSVRLAENTPHNLRIICGHYSCLKEAASALGAGKTTLYQAIGQGQVLAWLKFLPSARPRGVGRLVGDLDRLPIPAPGSALRQASLKFMGFLLY